MTKGNYRYLLAIRLLDPRGVVTRVCAASFVRQHATQLVFAWASVREFYEFTLVLDPRGLVTRVCAAALMCQHTATQLVFV